MKQFLSRKEAAQHLGISVASIGNWIRHGYITECGNIFSYDEILLVKKKIRTGEINRLNTRANKSGSNIRFIPNEYIGSRESINIINEIVCYIHENQIPVDQALFILSINLFLKTGDVISNQVDILFQFQKNNFKRMGVYRLIQTWFKEIFSENENYWSNTFKVLLSYDLPKERDVLGIIYQSIIYEGHKSNMGSYYTPEHVVELLVSNNLKPDSKALDPCCGTGQFLLSFCEYIDNPQNIYGFDMDGTAINVAKTNLLLYFYKEDFSPQIFHTNTLLLNPSETLYNNYFDFIATNPPWGAKYDKDALLLIKQNLKDIKSKESFSFFIRQSYNFLKNMGTMCFVLPESISNVKKHGDIREFIACSMDIEEIDILGKCFKNVLSSVITIRLKKERKDDNLIKIINGSKVYWTNQKQFIENKNSFFDIYVNELDRQIFYKMEGLNNFTLENRAEWALGIVTGDNKKFLYTSKIDDNFELIYKGSDIIPFKFKTPSNFISFKPESFQQLAPTNKYRTSEKLVYKFISSNLVFAYDNEGSLTLNSANILIPKVKDYSLKVVLGFLNSKLFNYYFKKKFNSIKVLRGDIEQLPFPVITEEQKNTIEKIVNNIINNEKTPDTVINELDLYIFCIFNISQFEREYIFQYLNANKAQNL